MDNEKYLVLVPGDDDEDESPLSPEEKAAEEKSSRRHWYICARVSADNLAKHIEQVESGARVSSSQVDSLEALRAQLAHSRRRVMQFEAEFINDPDIERDVKLEIQAADDIARTLGQEKNVDK